MKLTDEEIKKGLKEIGKLKTDERKRSLVQRLVIGLSRKMEHFWWRTMCPQPDKPILGSIKITGWLYNWTGKRAAFWHKLNCRICKG